MTGNIPLLLAALFPAVILCIYIYIKDRAEKEPIGLLIALLIAGVAICYPVVLVGKPVGNAIFAFYETFGTVVNGNLQLPKLAYYLYHLTDTMIGVALIEEGFKWLAMWLITSRNKNFNSLFDGIVYAVFVSLGFAAFENILYVMDYGWGTAFARMVTAVPGHMFDAVIMGCSYSMWHIYTIARKKEKKLAKQGLIQVAEPISGKSHLKASLILPVLAHGFYDFCCMVEEDWALFAFYGFVIFLYIYCFGKVRRMSNVDGEDSHAADAILLKKYPELRGYYANGQDAEKAKEDWKEQYRAEEEEFPQYVNWASKEEEK